MYDDSAPVSRLPWTQKWLLCGSLNVCGQIIYPLLVVGACLAGNAFANDRKLSDSIAYLKEHGIEWPTASGTAETAKRLRPILVDETTLQLTQQYLIDLRADDYRKRESASRELAKLRVPIDPLLGIQREPDHATEAGNLEFTWRLKQILAVRRSLALEDQLYHALVVIAETPVPGLASELLSTASALDGGDVRLMDATERAISKTVSSVDKALLRSLVGPDKPMPTRRRATAALAQLLAASDRHALEELLAIRNSDLRLAAARGAVLAGNMVGIPDLVSMLEDSSTSIRCQAAALLYQGTGEDFGYAGYDEPARRARSILKWNQWLIDWRQQQGSNGTRKSTRTDTASGRVLVGIQLKENPSAPKGRKPGHQKPTLKSNVLEFTPSGSIRWHMRSADLRGGTAITAIPLVNGARAIAFGNPTQSENALQQSMSIRFFDGNGQALGSLSGLAGMPALGLSQSGHLLVAAANEIVEVGVWGNLIGRTAFGGANTRVDFFARARGDRMIVVSSLAGTVREFSREGILLLEHGNLKRPVYARRMRNGGLIVAQKTTDETEPAILSYDSTGNLAWTFTPSQEIGTMTAVAALSSGNALYGSSTGLYEIGIDGRVTRTWINGSVRFVYAD